MTSSRNDRTRFLLPLCGLLCACDLGFSRQVTHYQIQIRCLLPDGKPVAGVQITTGEPRRTLRSDPQGLIGLPVEGREGQEVGFSISQLPPTLTLAEGTETRKVILKNYGGSSRHARTLQHEIHLRPKRETYVVLVSAEQAPQVQVAANGTRVAQLNSRSAAAFRIEGKPGDELKVVLLASKSAQLRGADPQQSFTLPENSSILSFHSSLFIKPQPKIRTVTKTGPRIVKWNDIR